jgi:hypothetical protein
LPGVEVVAAEGDGDGVVIGVGLGLGVADVSGVSEGLALGFGVAADSGDGLGVSFFFGAVVFRFLRGIGVGVRTKKSLNFFEKDSSCSSMARTGAATANAAATITNSRSVLFISTQAANSRRRA